MAKTNTQRVTSAMKIAALRKDLETVTTMLLNRVEHVEYQLAILDGKDVDYRKDTRRRTVAK